MMHISVHQARVNVYFGKMGVDAMPISLSKHIMPVSALGPSNIPIQSWKTVGLDVQTHFYPAPLVNGMMF